MRELAALKLAANQLRKLPYEMFGLEYLEEIQLFGNPLPNVPSVLNVKGASQCKFLMQTLQQALYPNGDPDALDASAGMLKNVSNLAGALTGGDQPKARRVLDMDAASEVAEEA